MRILIIEDEAEVARLLADAVRMQGHESTVAYGGEQGLALLRQGHHDGVFLDVVMPEMSGIEVLRRIRTIDPALPVVLITGRAHARELDEARRLGVTEILEKPFALTRLNEALAGLKLPGP